ncbi:MAG: hypothetical protein LBS58_03280 [Coriobacteriales bacterium]|nr:hypothetical protein [Coriobacteriales bacterium]
MSAEVRYNTPMDIFGTESSQARAIARYLASPIGDEDRCGQCLGFELEHFIVEAAASRRVFFEDDPATGKPGVEAILRQLAPLYDEEVYEPQPDGTQRLVGLARAYINITLEPGAQFEVSIGPCYTITDIDLVYRAFRAEIDPLLDAHGYSLLLVGLDPYTRVVDVPLIPKKRYEYMDRYFEDTGWGGKRMMRGSAATQVSIDFASEDDAVRKFRIANALCPLLYFIGDNSLVFEDTAVGSGATTYFGVPTPSRMARSVIWDNTDACRSLTAPFTFDEEFCFATYAASLLQAPAVFTYEQDATVAGKHATYQGAVPFSKALGNTPLGTEAIEHVLSLFFYDVRFKTYIEIRPADALPIEYALAYTALIKGVFYNEEALEYLAEKFKYLDAAAVAFAKTALREHGYTALVYQRPASEWLDELITFARAALLPEELPYLGPLATLVQERKTLVG